MKIIFSILNKYEAIDFIISKVAPDGISGNTNVEICPTADFIIDRVEYDSGGLFVRLNGFPVKVENLTRENVVMIASYFDGSWDGK